MNNTGISHFILGVRRGWVRIDANACCAQLVSKCGNEDVSQYFAFKLVLSSFEPSDLEPYILYYYAH